MGALISLTLIATAPYPHQQYPGCSIACVDSIREDLFKRSIPPEEVAAIFVERIQGKRG